MFKNILGYVIHLFYNNNSHMLQLTSPLANSLQNKTVWETFWEWLNRWKHVRGIVLKYMCMLVCRITGMKQQVRFRNFLRITKLFETFIIVSRELLFWNKCVTHNQEYFIHFKCIVLILTKSLPQINNS